MLAKWGVLDFAGGIVVHNTAGFAALASVLYVGRRHVVENKPHNVPLIALGTGLLWFGWYGFNAGSELRVDAVTGVGVPQHGPRRVALPPIAWLLVEWARGRQPKFVGLLTGAVAGLATITPAAGYVSPRPRSSSALLAGMVCYFAVALKNRLRWDDALDVWGVHGVGGFLGIVLLGVFASKRGIRTARMGSSSAARHSSVSSVAAIVISCVGVQFHLRNVVADQQGDADQSRPRWLKSAAWTSNFMARKLIRSASDATWRVSPPG